MTRNGIYKMDRNYGPPRYENKNNYTNLNDRRVNIERERLLWMRKVYIF